MLLLKPHIFITISYAFASLEMFLGDQLENPNVAILSSLQHYLVNVDLVKNHSRNKNQNYNEIPPYTRQNGHHPKVCCCCCCLVASVMSDSVWPYGLKPARLPFPLDSPGKNTGVGCHALLPNSGIKPRSPTVGRFFTTQPQRDTTSHQSEWPSSESLQTMNAGEGVGEREPSCTAGGKVNWYNHYGRQYAGSLRN